MALLKGACFALALSACSGPPVERASPLPAPLSASAPAQADKVALGAKLFFDPRLSANRAISCASCHDILGGSGTIASSFALGVGGRIGARNPPTVWNSGNRSLLFWDGRARSLEEQAHGPITNPDEMSMTPDSAVRALDQVAAYRTEFAVAFSKERAANRSNGISFDEIVSAIAAFERTLATPDSPFDLAARGDEDALGDRARRGYETFRDVGCIGCHGSPTFTSKDFYARFPLRPIPDLELSLGFTRDRGRLTSTGRRADASFWRVPSLRNVAVTAPYFHNGSISSLEQAVRIMGRAQLARTLTDEEVGDLVAFLESLTGRPPRLERPALPPD